MTLFHVKIKLTVFVAERPADIIRSWSNFRRGAA